LEKVITEQLAPQIDNPKKETEEATEMAGRGGYNRDRIVNMSLEEKKYQEELQKVKERLRKSCISTQDYFAKKNSNYCQDYSHREPWVSALGYYTHSLPHYTHTYLPTTTG
jgi:hypothetical protein